MAKESTMRFGQGPATRTGRRERSGARGPRPLAFSTMLAVALVVTLQPAVAVAGGPAVGEAAPAFSLAGTDGKTYTLEGLLAERGGLVLAWFPKAFTPG